MPVSAGHAPGALARLPFSTPHPRPDPLCTQVPSRFLFMLRFPLPCDKADDKAANSDRSLLSNDTAADGSVVCYRRAVRRSLKLFLRRPGTPLLRRTASVVSHHGVARRRRCRQHNARCACRRAVPDPRFLQFAVAGPRAECACQTGGCPDVSRFPFLACFPFSSTDRPPSILPPPPPHSWLAAFIPSFHSHSRRCFSASSHSFHCHVSRRDTRPCAANQLRPVARIAGRRRRNRMRIAQEPRPYRLRRDRSHRPRYNRPEQPQPAVLVPPGAHQKVEGPGKSRPREPRRRAID